MNKIKTILLVSFILIRSGADAEELKNATNTINIKMEKAQSYSITPIPGTGKENLSQDDVTATYKGIVNLNIKKDLGKNSILIRRDVPYDLKVTFGLKTSVALYVYTSYDKNGLKYGVLYMIKNIPQR